MPNKTEAFQASLTGLAFIVFSTLHRQIGEDVDIAHLYVLTRGGAFKNDPFRHQQRYLGPVLTRLNRRMARECMELHIRPGHARKTYRMVAVRGV